MEDRSADPGAGARCPDMEPEAEQDVGDVTAALERTPVPLRAILDPTVEPLGTQRVYAWEGCLSVDGWQSIVPRSRRVRLQGTELEADEIGRASCREGSGGLGGAAAVRAG